MNLSFLSNALNAVSNGLKYPVIFLLLVAIAYALFCIGSVLVELFVERRHFKVAIPEFLQAMDKSTVDDMPKTVVESGMLLRQKKALLTLFKNRTLPEEARWALAKKLLSEEVAYYGKKASRNEMAAKVAPMLGLMGTLIPLGPGIVAMGKGQTELLASSLQVAFDTTVAGLVVAVICMVIAKIRRTWYASYNASLEAATTTMLEKIDHLEQAGELGNPENDSECEVQ